MTPSELSPEARRLLDAARGGDEPDPADRARVRATLFAQIGLAAAVGASAAAATASGSAAATTGGAVAATSATTTAAMATAAAATGAGAVTTSAAVGLGLAAKLAIGAALAAGIGGTGYAVATSGNSPSRPPATTMAASVAAPADDAPDAPPPLSVEPDTTAAPTVDTAPTLSVNPDKATTPIASAVPDRSADRPPRKPSPGAAAGAAPSVASTKAEQSLLARATAALRSGDPAHALELLDEHARTFATGALVEERSGARILALCGLGRSAEAAHDTARFTARWPRSILAARIRAACAQP